MTRFTRSARRWSSLGLCLGASLSCGSVLAGDHLHRKGQLVAVPVTTTTAPAQAVSVPIYSIPTVQAVPVQLGYIQTVQAGAVCLSAPTQCAAVTTAQAPVINIKLEAPPTAATTAPVSQGAIPTPQAASTACATPIVASTPSIVAATVAAPTCAVATVLVPQQAVPTQLYVVSKPRTGFFKHFPFSKSK